MSAARHRYGKSPARAVAWSTATLYGVAFGAGVAGPIGHYLRNLLDERLGVLERAEQSVAELIARAGRDAGLGD